MKRRMIAWVAVLCLIVRLLPTVAMAAEDEKMAGTTPNTPIVATGENGWLVESENGYMLYGISASKVAAWFKEHSDYNGQLYISAVISKDIDTIVPYAMTSMNTDLKADNGAVIDGHNSFTIVKVDFSKNEWIGLIGDHAFFNCSEMEGTLDLSASPIMMEIGDYAFYGCSKLSGTLCINTSYEYPLQTIGDYAFYGCTSLEGVDFSKVSNSGLKEIGDYAFYGCESLKTFIWPYYGEDTVIGDSAFENCTALRTMCKYGSEATGSKFELLPYIDEIGENAFKNCFAPEVKVKIPQSVKVIEKNAFSSDRISQIIVELDPNYVTEETYAGYDLTAFATGNDDLLIVLPNGKYFNKVYENGKLSADLRARIAYPTSITFKPDKNSDTGVKQEKLYNQSLCYEQQENGFWVYDENYALPEIPPDVSAGDKPKDGYTNEWIIDETGVILQHDSLLKGKEWVVSTQHLSASPTSETLAQPTIKFSMDGVALDDSELEYRYGVPVFKVPLDGEVHTVGVQVDHDLLQSKVDDNASEYVYFRYCWWDEQMWGKDGEGLRKYPLNGDRCDEVDSSNQRIFSKENPNWSLENDTVQFDRQETDYAEIPIRTSADSRTGDSQYMVEIYGYHVTDGDTEHPTLFYKSHYNFIDFGSDNDTEATVGRCYTLQVETIAPETYQVTFNVNGHGTAPGAQAVQSGGKLNKPADPTASGYTFGGWYKEADCTTAWDFETDTVTADTTLYAKWTKDSTGGGGGGTTWYTLTYDSNGGTTYPRESYSYGTTVQLNKVPTREGYQFTGWYADANLTQPISSIRMTGNKTVYAGWQASAIPDQLNGDDHFAYVVGYENGAVRPNANISRAETATIFFRLLKDEVRDGNLTTVNSFEDVTEGMWCNTAISTMAGLGIVKGRSDKVFDPDANITRAEFAAICARFDTGITEGDSEFTDISGHWAEEEIKRAVSLGWLLGYEDGTFRPDQPITRAEAMTIINRVLCRIPESEDDLLPGMRVWPDNNPGDWYYLAVQEATNSHDYRHKGEIYETWTALTADPDWARYEE